MMRSVRLVSIGRVEIRIHPLVLVVLAGACVLGKLYELLQALVALALHEAAHAVAARAFCCRMQSVELQPFGGVMRLSERVLPTHTEWCIAAAGPAASFVAAGVTALTCYISPRTGARIEPFLAYNLTLGVINLLPALPLDGGRIVKCILSRWVSPSNSMRIAAWTGVAAGAAMLGICAVQSVMDAAFPPMLPVMGAFLLLSAVRELKTAPEKQLALLWHKEDMLFRGGMDVHTVAAHTSMQAEEALRLLRGNRYNCIRIVDGHMRSVGELDEAALVNGMVRLGSGAPVGEILRFDRREKM